MRYHPDGTRTMTGPLRFSIVTPSFNQSAWLQQAISSVLDQEYPAVQLIVMDGGSTDGSKELLERNSGRIDHWQSQPDGGQTAALNAGIAHVRGEITGWINSDDYYLPGAFAAAAKRFAGPDRPDVVFGYSVNVDANSNVLRDNRHDDFSAQALLAVGMDLRQQAMFWRSELNAKAFPLDESLRFCMDLQLVIRLVEEGARFVRIPEYLGAFRIHSEAKTATIPEVCTREYDELMRSAMDTLRVTPRSQLSVLLQRRWNFWRRGEWKYALLGGRRSLPAHARASAQAAALWGREGSPP